MNDLEERLRTDLLQATTGVEDSVDAEEALLAGQRARSSRRIARTVGVTALAAVVGLASWGFLREAAVLGGHPDPMGTVSAEPSLPATPSTPYVPTDPMSATFDLGGKMNGEIPTYDTVRVSVKPAGDQVVVTVALDEGPRGTELHYTIPAGKLWYVPVDKHLVVGILPGRPTWFEGRYDAAKGAVTYRQPLTGIDATAFLTGFIEAGGADTIRGFIWRGSDGEVRDSFGNDVPSADIALGDDTYLIYRDVALDVIGVAPRAGGGYSFRLSDSTPTRLFDGGMGRQDDDGTWTWVRFGALPPGAHDITLDLAPGDGSWASAVMGDGTVVVLAVNRVKSDQAKVVTSVSYRDADGKLVRFPK